MNNTEFSVHTKMCVLSFLSCLPLYQTGKLYVSYIDAKRKFDYILYFLFFLFNTEARLPK